MSRGHVAAGRLPDEGTITSNNPPPASHYVLGGSGDGTARRFLEERVPHRPLG